MDNVFKPSHRLPTMSIDDYLKQEYERGNVLKGGTDSEPKPKLGDGEDEEVDENAIYKKREWDNFKDGILLNLF